VPVSQVLRWAVNLIIVGVISRRSLAEQFGIHESDVRYCLTDCRRALRDFLRVKIRDYSATDDDVECELASVLGE